MANQSAKHLYEVWTMKTGTFAHDSRHMIETCQLETDDKQAAEAKAIGCYGCAKCMTCGSIMGGDEPTRNGRIIADNARCFICGYMLPD